MTIHTHYLIMYMQEAYAAYMQHFKDSPVSFLRDCLELEPAAGPVALEEVEPAQAIMERFCTGGMSLGAISRETHETIAIAMNRIGGAPPAAFAGCPFKSVMTSCGMLGAPVHCNSAFKED